MTGHVVVAGGGIGGLEVALGLERNGYTVTVIDPDEQLIFYPALHHVLRGVAFDKVTIQYEDKFADRNITHVQDHVTGIDPRQQILTHGTGTENYDDLVIAVGSATSYASVNGTGRAHTLRFKEDILDIHDRFAANAINDVVIVGGGATGIESAAAIHAAHSKEVSITVVEGNSSLLAQFNGELGQRVEHDFVSKGITVLTARHVTELGDDRVILTDGTNLSSDLTIWAGGITPNPVIENFPLEQNTDGLLVDDHMRCQGQDHIYAVGDVAAYAGKVNRAFYALYEGKTVADNILRSTTDKPLKPRNIPWDPNLIYLGSWDAVFEYKDFIHRGRVPALMRNLGVEQRYLLTRRHWL